MINNVKNGPENQAVEVYSAQRYSLLAIQVDFVYLIFITTSQ